MKIKPLVWYSRPHEEECSASSLHGSFDISTRWRRYHLEFTAWDGPNNDLGWFDNIDDAKSAAYNDHEERVMAVLREVLDEK